MHGLKSRMKHCKAKTLPSTDYGLSLLKDWPVLKSDKHTLLQLVYLFSPLWSFDFSRTADNHVIFEYYTNIRWLTSPHKAQLRLVISTLDFLRYLCLCCPVYLWQNFSSIIPRSSHVLSFLFYFFLSLSIHVQISFLLLKECNLFVCNPKYYIFLQGFSEEYIYVPLYMHNLICT